ncbi:MAG: hypothetical protein QM753_19055 [Thermomicrobiales bacterium]
MKAAIQRHPIVAWAGLLVIVLAIAFGSYMAYLAYTVDALPWQTVPTPYAGPAFEGIPGFGAAATATPVP